MPLRSLLPCAVFGVAFALSAIGLRGVTPMPRVPVVSEKLEHLAANAAAHDVLFLGPSRIYHGIEPALFDRLAAENGRPTRSFNRGVDGMYAPEDAYFCERALERRTGPLRWVFLEIGLFHQEYAVLARVDERSVYWHDAPRTALVARHLFTDLRPFRSKRWRRALAERAERALLLARHVRLWALRFANHGRGAALAQLLRGAPAAEEPESALGARGDGFTPIETHDRLPGVWEEWDRQLAARRERPGRRVPIGATEQANLERILEFVRAAGAEPVIVIAPVPLAQVPVPQPGTDALVLDFSNPQEWPDLYRREHRADFEHVNGTGAAHYTRALVESWLAATAARDGH